MGKNGRALLQEILCKKCKTKYHESDMEIYITGGMSRNVKYCPICGEKVNRKVKLVDLENVLDIVLHHQGTKASLIDAIGNLDGIETEEY